MMTVAGEQATPGRPLHKSLEAQETNYVPPEPDEMKAEVQRIREWQKRVKKYRS
ncbi:MAG TPA: hypothetical protein VFG33_13185 [Kribbella sp.]|nr:hypothetical protein [Kribbella sp.]